MADHRPGWGEHVVVDPAIQGGRPVIEATGTPVDLVLDTLADDMTVEEVCEVLHLTEEQVRAALAYAVHSSSDETVVGVG